MDIYPPIRGRIHQSYDSVVIIPASDEDPNTIASAIDAVERQHGLGEIKTAVILIINNARNATAEIVAMNKYALDEIQAENARRRWPKLQQHLFIVDASTGANAPEICNVGVASRLAADIALTLSKLTGLLHRTDADSTMGQGFIEATHRIMKLRPEVAGVTGPVHFIGSSEEEKRMQILHAQNRCKMSLERQCFNFAGCMPGVNMTFRVRDYKRVRGFQSIPGGEDTELSYQLNSLRKKIVSDNEVSVITSLRNSDRTDSRCGHGQQMIRVSSFLEAPEYAPAWSPEQRSWFSKYVSALSAHTQENAADAWKKILSEVVNDCPCDDGEIQGLIQTLSFLPMSYHPLQNAFFVSKLEYLTEVRYQQIPLLQAVPQWRQQLLDDEHISEPIETVLQILDPNRLVGKFSDKFQEIQAMIVDIETALTAASYCSDIECALKLLHRLEFLNKNERRRQLFCYFYKNVPKLIALLRLAHTFPIPENEMSRDIPFELLNITIEMNERHDQLQALVKTIDASSDERKKEILMLQEFLDVISVAINNNS